MSYVEFEKFKSASVYIHTMYVPPFQKYNFYFKFQTYSIPSGGSLSGLDEHSIEIGTMPIPTSKTNRSNSVNMPGKSLSIESGSSK